MDDSASDMIAVAPSEGAAHASGPAFDRPHAAAVFQRMAFQRALNRAWALPLSSNFVIELFFKGQAADFAAELRDSSVPASPHKLVRMVVVGSVLPLLSPIVDAEG